MTAHLSQFGEAEIISEYFKDYTGHFVDVGASNGVALSNTYELGLLKGWHGLLVEASPIHFQNLVANYLHRGGFEFVHGALWHERKLMKFHLNNYLYSSLIEKDEANLYQAHYWVQTVIPADLALIQPEADFISVDIEGADLIVFPHLMAAYPKCRLICVEHANSETLKHSWKAMFENYKLRIIGTTPENFIAAK